ncbi:C-type lectin domain family 2 member D-like [Eublepharis macularius]|uniref:C-type lectin domain family 2 member D-like n=1 Tax=Eublepharis macularius TaxID=481883 RepID=A0AA97KW10_EUBMA|nr:C-type lectin domain family 2 member D-like [Eublepharis macularius]XP_054832159.1 C-type lectin domain family 2 member D-like [Eublepharis macularius]
MSGQCTLQHLFLSVNEKKMGQRTEHQGTSITEDLAICLDSDKANRGGKADKVCRAFLKNHVLYGIGGAIILTLLMAVIGLATAWAVRGSGTCSVCEEIVTYALCPNGWIGYLGNCYYFSEDEADWLSSLRNCSALGASLSTIETQQEMTFLQRYKGPIYHWIALKKDRGKSWEWANGRVFNNTIFEIVEGGDCAYLNDEAVMSSWCRTKKNWICSKPDASVQRRKQAEERGVKQAYMDGEVINEDFSSEELKVVL